jgi:hypothetical protein
MNTLDFIVIARAEPEAIQKIALNPGLLRSTSQ